MVSRGLQTDINPMSQPVEATVKTLGRILSSPGGESLGIRLTEILLGL